MYPFFVDLEQQYINLTIDEPKSSAADWNQDGYLIKKKLMPEDLMISYEDCWLRHNAERLTGWPHCTPYREHQELLEILSYKGIHDTMKELISEPAGVHLNLTGWVSTTRNWHQDTYLNPPGVGDYYCAVWIALDDIHPDSGPFQFVPGSHMWRTVTREKVLARLPQEKQDHNWPRHSEELLTDVFEHQIKKRNAEVVSYLPKRGDVLFWHGRLLHRGSLPNNESLLRKTLIAHYSGIKHRKDMPPAQRYKDGWFFPIDDNSMMR